MGDEVRITLKAGRVHYTAPTGVDPPEDGWENIGWISDETSLLATDDGSKPWGELSGSLEIENITISEEALRLMTGRPAPVTMASMEDAIRKLAEVTERYAFPQRWVTGYDEAFLASRERPFTALHPLTDQDNISTMDNNINETENTMNLLTNKKTKRVLDRKTTAGNLGAHDVGNLVQVTDIAGVEFKAILRTLFAAESFGAIRLTFSDVSQVVRVDPWSKATVWTLETPEDDA